MKQLSLISIFLLLLTSQPSFAEKTGNGGGSWLCRNADQTIRGKPVLVDLFEAEADGLNIVRTEVDAEIQFKEAMERLKVANEKFYNALLPFIDDVAGRWPQKGDTELKVVDDALYSRIPRRETCPGGKIEYGQVVNFKDDGTIEVDHVIRRLMTVTDQAALRAHEPIYALLRDNTGDTNSILARKMVGVLFSDRDPRSYGEIFNVSFLPRPGLYGQSSGQYCGYIVRIDKNQRLVGFSTTSNPWDKDGVRCGQQSQYTFRFDPRSKFLTPVQSNSLFEAISAELLGDDKIVLTVRVVSGNLDSKSIEFKKAEN